MPYKSIYSGDDSTPAAPPPAAPTKSAGGSGGYVSIYAGGGGAPAASAAPAKKSGGGLFHVLGSGLGSALNVVKAAPGVVGTLATKGGAELYHSFKDTNETQAAAHPAKNSVFTKTGRAAAAKNTPLTYSALASLGTTVRQIPDTAAAVAPGGVGFGQSSLGQQIKHEGVLNTAVAKGADIATIFGGVGALGKVAGAGRLAEVSRLGTVADAGIKAAGLEGKIATAADAEKAARAAEAAGDVNRATNLSSIAKTLGEKEGLVAQGAGTVGERATQAAVKIGHLGGHVAGAPFKPYELAAGALGKIPGVATAIEKGGEAIRESKFAKMYDASKELRHAQTEDIRGEQARLNHSTAAGFKAARAAVGADPTAEAALVLDRIGTARAAGQHLTGLSDEELGRALGVHASPEAFKMARDYHAGALAPEQAAALDTASQHLDTGVFAPKQERFLTGHGEAERPSAATLASRQGEVANPLEPSQAGHAAQTRKLQAPIAARSEKVTQRLKVEADKLDEAAPKLNTSDERLLARKAEAAKRARLVADAEAARSDRLAGTVLREQGKNATTAANREGQVMGRARERMLERDQLDTGVEARAKQAALKARRLEKGAAAAEERAAKVPAPKEKAAQSPRDAAIRKAHREVVAMGVDPASPEGQDYINRAAAKTEAALAPAKTPKFSDLSKKGKAESSAAVKRSAADEARAEADQIKGVKGPRSRGEVQSDISRDSRLANQANKIEAGQAERHLSGEATRQGSALERAQRRQAGAEAEHTAAQDRTQQRAEQRLQAQKDKANQKLADTRAKYTAKLTDAKTAAGASLAAAPAATRTTLFQMRDIAGNLHDMANEADAAGDAAKAADLRARADKLPKTLADMKAQGVEGGKYVFGGIEGEAKGGGKGAPGPVGRTKLATSRLKETGTVPTTFEGQLQKALENARGTARNEFSPKLAERITGKTGVATAGDLPHLAGLEGKELAAALTDEGYRPWDPTGTGRTITGDALNRIDAGTPIIPREYAAKVNRTVRVPEGEDVTFGQMLGQGALKGIDKATRVARFAKLVEPGWQFKKMLGDPAMLAAMGVTPGQVLSHVGEAVKAVREGDLTPHLGSAAEGRLGMDEPGSKLGRVAQKGTSAIFTPFQKADAVAREIAYRAKLAEGFSPQAAAAAVRRGLGDLHDLTASEASVGRRVFTFYPWQKHVAQTMLRVPFEHPAGLLQAAHAQQLAHPGGEPNGPGKMEQSTNPFLSSVLSMISEAAPDRQVGALGSQVNPVVRDAIAAALGISPSRGFSPIQMPGQKYGAGPQLGFALKHPEEFAKFVGHGLAPVVTAQNLANTQPAANGKIPQRFETGEPVRHGTRNVGTPKASKLGATTRMQALLQILGIEPPTPKKK